MRKIERTLNNNRICKVITRRPHYSLKSASYSHVFNIFGVFFLYVHKARNSPISFPLISQIKRLYFIKVLQVKMTFFSSSIIMYNKTIRLRCLSIGFLPLIPPCTIVR